MRAAERLRPPATRILDDAYAAGFLGAALRAALAAGPASSGIFLPSLAAFVVTRHRFVDDALAAALASGEVEQVVVLGAGYDARAWRFAAALAGRPVFEVDHPATQARKARLLPPDAPDVDVRRVAIDFHVDRLEDVLARAGFVRGRPTFFIWEGVSMYLHRAAVEGTLAALHGLGGPGSALAMDAWFELTSAGPAALAHRSAARLLSLISEPILFSLPTEEAPALLRAHGWRVEDVADAADLAKRYVRDGRTVYPADYVLLARREG